MKQLTIGHQYLRQHLEKPKAAQYLKLNPGGFQLMCERPEVQIGKVVQVHVLRAANCPFPDANLKELATTRLKFREDPSSIPDLSTYFQYRKSCWLLEETEDGEFRCDCPVGHKGKVCKHELALNYLYKRIEVLPHAAALPLGARRPKGRPMNINMEKPKEASISAISTTTISPEEVDVPSGRDEATEEIDIVDQLPLILDEVEGFAGVEVQVQEVPHEQEVPQVQVAPRPRRTRQVVAHLVSDPPPPRKRTRKNKDALID